jgi:hypothetical protein
MRGLVGRRGGRMIVLTPLRSFTRSLKLMDVALNYSDRAPYFSRPQIEE